MKTGVIVADVVAVKRLNSTQWGNPRFDVTLREDGQEVTRTTSSDVSAAYDFISSIKPGDTVAITVTRAGRILTAHKTTRIKTR